MLWEAPAAFNATPLVAGANTLAAEVHQSSATSSDIAFAMRLIGTQGTIVPPLRILSITVEGGNVAIRHNGAEVPGDEYVQAATSLADPPSGTAWVTQSGGPHASPYNAGAATGPRHFRLKGRP